jgi:hypothetical protein
MVAPGDVGKVSGRDGRTVNAIRSTTLLGEPAGQLIAAWAGAAQPRERPSHQAERDHRDAGEAGRLRRPRTA